MTLRFVDSFDSYVTADLLLKWTSTSNSPIISAANGRNSTASLRLTNLGMQITKVLDAQATWVIGFSLKPALLPSSAFPIISFLDGSTVHLRLRLGTNGKLFVERGDGTTLATGTTVLSASVTQYIEIKVTISDTVGVAVVKLNGVTEINLSAADTRNGGNATSDRFVVGGGPADNTNYDYDDLYVCDTAGSTNNDFLGDVRIQALLPSGDGNSSQWAGSDGNSVNNSLLVDEAAENGDTDYVSSGTVGDKDTYAFGDLTPTAGTVYGIQLTEVAKKDDAGSRSIVSVVRTAGIEADSAAIAVPSSYAFLMDIRETKPGGGAFSISDVNASEFGFKVNA